jgi:hypothetical protein
MFRAMREKVRSDMRMFGIGVPSWIILVNVVAQKKRQQTRFASLYIADLDQNREPHVVLMLYSRRDFHPWCAY